MNERIAGARPMMDLMAKKIFSNTSVTARLYETYLICQLKE